MKFENLTKQQLWKLRQEIVLNSLFIYDYENSFKFNANDVCTFMEGYVEFIHELMAEDESTDFNAYDNQETLYSWFNCYDDLSWVKCMALSYNEHKTPNGKVYKISAVEDCGENEGGLYCEIYDENDNYLDNLTIHKGFEKHPDDIVKEFMIEHYNN
jgi:hypothetical protein